MDYDMPELDGAQAAQRILEGAVRPWIIGMSGRGEAEYHFRAAGVTDFLAKPFEIATLQAMLKNTPAGGERA
jgi:CheY-like chemotaxis protein